MQPRLRTSRRRTERRGAVLVLAAVTIVMLIAFLAFAVDVGYIEVVRSELQRSADAAALAAAWELYDNEALTGQSGNMLDEIAQARAKAAAFAGYNAVVGAAPAVDNTNTGDVTIGYLANPTDSSASINTTLAYQNQSNAVQVRVRRAADMNGEAPYFFARIFGYDTFATQATATAAVATNFGGFRSPGGSGNIMMLPFALDKETWDALVAGNATDSYSYNEATGAVTAGSDGIKECNLYPQGTGSPGNRGTVDIGSCNNSTADIARQIVYGISPADLQAFGGELKLDTNGKLYLNGDTGISAGVKDELTSIIGKPRLIPIFQTVAGPGNNASYTIVAFAGIRITYVKLTGSMSSKKVMIQPCKMIVNGGIVNPGPQTSWFVTSPAWLVR